MSEQTIFEHLRKAGMSVAGALGAMGNMKEESGCEACRVQGDFTSDRIMSRDYATKVDSGIITEDQFASDGKGWGLVQFTWSGYKRGLLTFCRRRSTSIANEEAQNDYLINVLKTEFSSLWSFLCSTNDIHAATERFCKEFERPAYNNVTARYNAALKLRDELQAKAVEQIDNGVERFWPPRMICNGMNGADVNVLQSLLTAHGYIVPITGVFSDSTEKAVRKFQEDHGLAVDGVVGPKTWAELVKM